MINVLLAIEKIDDPNERELIGNIYEKYSSYSKRIAYNYLNNVSDAEDAVGNVFLKVIKYRYKFVDASEEKVKGLIYLYTKCTALDFLKKRDKFKFISYNNVYEDERGNNFDLELSDDIDILRDYVNKDMIERLKRKINCLPEPTRGIIQLKFYEDHTNVEIGELLGMNSSTVSTIISRTTKKLKKDLGVYVND